MQETTNHFSFNHFQAIEISPLTPSNLDFAQLTKKGKLTTMKAAARKLAVIYYNVMTKGVEYVEYGINNYEQKIKEQRIKYLQKQAVR